MLNLQCKGSACQVSSTDPILVEGSRYFLTAEMIQLQHVQTLSTSEGPLDA